MNRALPINVDCGENFGNYNLYNEEIILANADMINVACGFHAGDFSSIINTIKKAGENGIKIGAHPSYPDLQGFGRRFMTMNEKEIYDLTTFQIATIYGLCKRFNIKLHHVKAHGALYHTVSYGKLGEAYLKAIKDFDSALTVLAPSDSDLYHLCLVNGLNCMQEAFADRRYNANMQLLNRSEEGSVYHQADSIISQYKNICDGYVIDHADTKRNITAQTICIHGDNIALDSFFQFLKNE
ncbi:MAG: 5-oxoprolinase subunit PxpA [Bacteroidota bacterium]